MAGELPSGTVTFLFTDVEGSTRLLRDLGPERYADALAAHRRVVREACRSHGGVEVDTQGDAFFFAFPVVSGAVSAAAMATEALDDGPIRVRMGLHTGTPHLTEEGYVGEDVHLGARIAASGHGGQVLVSQATRDQLGPRNSLLLDLGEHRLKDFGEPVWIYQLGSERFPPLKTISNTNLPRPASSFVGREREVAEVAALLRDGARFVTLTGPGGSGKTRLALEAAAGLVPEFRNGTFWVGLAALRDPALVPETIAQTVGATDGLAEHIGERELLLLVDNFEQVVDAAAELAALVEACSNLRLLVTSRELLRVRGEVEYAVPPLAEPEAIRLFCERTRLEPSDEIAELCRRLDELPLAVELAAARTSVLSPAQILERLSKRLDLLKGGRDAEARQQTLRATIEWSHDLLGRGEQRLFAHLAVFAGGCTLQAAEEVCGAELDVLQSLVDKSLVRHTGERFWMLETIREYALERLEASGEAQELPRRHAEFFLALGEEAEPHLRQESTEWADRVEPEHDNLRAALDCLESSGELELALRLAAAVGWFWLLRGHIGEGRRRVESLLARDTRPTAHRAKVLGAAAEFALDESDHRAARLRAEEALALDRNVGDEWRAAHALLLIGLSFAFEDKWSEAQARFDESVRLFDRLGDEHWALQASRRLAWSYEELGDVERARAIQTDMLRRARASGDRFIEAKALAVLAQYDLDEGRVDETVVSNLEQAHRIERERRDHPDRYWHAILVCRFARALALRGQATAAVELLGCFDALMEELGIGFVEAWVQRMNDQTLAGARANLDEAVIAEARQEGRRLTTDEAAALALDTLSSAPREGSG